MRFEAIAGVRPSLGRAPVYATPFGSPPLESLSVGAARRSVEKIVGEGEACATRQAASRDEICARFQSQKKCGQKARQLRTRREMLRKTSAAGARAPLSPAGFP